MASSGPLRICIIGSCHSDILKSAIEAARPDAIITHCLPETVELTTTNIAEVASTVAQTYADAAPAQFDVTIVAMFCFFGWLFDDSDATTIDPEAIIVEGTRNGRIYALGNFAELKGQKILAPDTNLDGTEPKGVTVHTQLQTDRLGNSTDWEVEPAWQLCYSLFPQWRRDYSKPQPPAGTPGISCVITWSDGKWIDQEPNYKAFPPSVMQQHRFPITSDATGELISQNISYTTAIETMLMEIEQASA